MEVVHRRVIFLLVVGIIFVITVFVFLRRFWHFSAPFANSIQNRIEGLDADGCPISVSQCIIPGMQDILNKKIQHQQDLISKYTSEIVNIERRYPTRFQIISADISGYYMDATTNKPSPSPTIYANWVSGKLPYPQLSFYFPNPEVGPDGDPGPQGPNGLADPSSFKMPAGIMGPPGYIGQPQQL